MIVWLMKCPVRDRQVFCAAGSWLTMTLHLNFIIKDGIVESIAFLNIYSFCFIKNLISLMKGETQFWLYDDVIGRELSSFPLVLVGVGFLWCQEKINFLRLAQEGEIL